MVNSKNTTETNLIIKALVRLSASHNAMGDLYKGGELLTES